MTVITAETDHHWNPNHPNYDPDCFCGVPAGSVTYIDVTTTEDGTRVPVKRNGNGVQRKRTAPANPVSEKQAAYIRKLAAAADFSKYTPSAIPGIEPVMVQAAQDDLEALIATLTGGRDGSGSRLIEALQMLSAGPERTNAYPGECSGCGGHIEAHGGELYKDGGWKVRHFPECPATVVPKAPERIVEAKPGSNGVDITPLGHNRRYAVLDDTAPKGVRFLRISKPETGKWAGWAFAKDGDPYGSGGKVAVQNPKYPTAKIDSRTWGTGTTDLLRQILADPGIAEKLYAERTGNCYACGLTLSDPTSVELGIGPTCRSK